LQRVLILNASTIPLESTALNSVKYKVMTIWCNKMGVNYMPGKLDFITPTVMRILEFFFLNPVREFHERELMRRVKVSKGSANKILRQLADHGFLERRKMGRMVFYRLAMGNPVVRQFKVLSNVYSLKILLDRIKQDTKKVILFGSCADGKDVGESDIDLFVLTSNKSTVRSEVSRFNRSSNRKVVPIIVDANEFVKLKKDDEPLYERIQRGIVLWETE